MKLEMKSNMYVQCCQCRKFRLEDGTYELRVVDGTIKVSHTYCEECLAIVMAEIAASK